jgi:hypothetical protein
MIDEIIDCINDGFDKIHQDQIVIGIAQRVYRVSSSGSIEYMPGIVNMDGEAIYAGLDDIQSLIIYHKTNTANLSLNPRIGYGDSKISEDNILCSLIACWDTRKMPLQSADLLLLLRARFPQEIKGIDQISQILIFPSSAILNTKQIFDSEYTVQEGYLLPIYMNFIQINYTILIKYDQQCINKCINC